MPRAEVCSAFTPHLRQGANTIQTSSDSDSRVTWNVPHNHDLYIYNEAKMPEHELIILHYLLVWLHPSILQLAMYLYHFYAIQISGCNCHVGISDVVSHMNAAIWLKQPYMYMLNPGFFGATGYITSVMYPVAPQKPGSTYL